MVTRQQILEHNTVQDLKSPSKRLVIQYQLQNADEEESFKIKSHIFSYNMGMKKMFAIAHPELQPEEYMEHVEDQEFKHGEERLD